MNPKHTLKSHTLKSSKQGCAAEKAATLATLGISSPHF